MFSFGFYNSSNGDRMYNATHFGKIFDGVIQDGVFGAAPQPLNTKFNVEPNSTPDLTVILNPGKAWLMHTWNILDAKTSLSFNQALANYKRTDAIVLEINNDYADLSGSFPRTNGIKIVPGSNTLISADDNPPVLTQIWNQNQTERRIWQYPIAYVTVYGSDYNTGSIEFKANQIKSDNIKNRINPDNPVDSEKYSTWIPLVTGATMDVDLSSYLPDWESAFDAMVNNDTIRFNDFMNTIAASSGGDFVPADVSEGFQGVLRYYELIDGQYIPTSDVTPDPLKTYYVFNNSSSIMSLNTKVDQKILYGTQPAPSSLDPGQVYFQVE